MLINKQISLNDEVLKSKYYPLFRAIYGEKPKVVMRLIQHGADISQDEFKSLHVVIQGFGRARRMYYPRDSWYRLCKNEQAMLQILEIMLEAISRNPDEKFKISAMYAPTKWWPKNSAILNAIRSYRDELIQFFLKFVDKSLAPLIKIDWLLDRNRRNPFHVAGKLKLQTVHALIEKLPHANVLINLKNRQNVTPLQQLAEHRWEDKIEYVKLMLTKGMADPDITDYYERTALHMSVQMDDVPTSFMEAFLSAGCRTDIRLPDGDTALKIALRRKLRKPIELLLAFGADLNKEPYLTGEDLTPYFGNLAIYDDYSLENRRADHIQPDLLMAMKELHQSNELNSLKRLCRKVIRCHLKPNADMIIDTLSNIPSGLKSFLMLENEPEVLASRINWDSII